MNIAFADTRKDHKMLIHVLFPIAGTMDYRTARLECLKILKSPSFDWLGEAYQLRPSELLERNITPPSQTSRNSRERVHQSSPAKRTDNGGRVHGVEDDDVGYSQSDSGADNESEDEDDEDEPLKIPVCIHFCHSKFFAYITYECIKRSLTDHVCLCF